MKRLVLTTAAIIMTAAVFSQEAPAVDRFTTNAGDAELSFIGHGSLMIKFGNYIIHIDPVRSSGSYANLPKADLILVTHEHGDHLDADLVNQLKKDNTRMLCNSASASKIPFAETIKPGESVTTGNISVEAVHAYNIKNERAPGQPFHPKGSGNGYIISLGGKRIYIAGDTENTPEMKALKNIDVAFLPMNLPYTMTPEMVADAAMAFKPVILYPYHFGNTDTSIIVKLLAGSGIEVRIRNLK